MNAQVILLCLIFVFQFGFGPVVEKRKIELINDLGIITFSIPKSQDTIHNWLSFSDTRCDHRRFYRYQHLKYSLFQESFFVDASPDTIEAITIKHSEYNECYFPFGKEITLELYLKEQHAKISFYSEESNVIKDINIQDRYLMYLVDKREERRNEIHYIALTYHNGAEIEIDFVMKNVSNIDLSEFSENSARILKTFEFN